MAKIIIFPNPSFFSHAFMAAVGPEPDAQRPAAPNSVRGLLEERRNSLMLFSQMIRSTAFGLGFAQEAQVSKVPEAPVTILESIGAIIVDEETVDRVALEGVFQATVLDNVLVDPHLPQVGISTSGPVDWHLSHINVTAARNKNLNGSGVLVGVLDTGIDGSHSEFSGKTIHFMEFDKNGNQVPAGAPSRDAGSHGTHVCGLIAGSKVGVAPKADIAMAAVLTIPGPNGLAGYLVQILTGLNWLIKSDFRGPQANPGVDLVNASLGSPGFNPYLYSSLAQARQAAGTLIAAAIGNSGTLGIDHHGSPGNYDITVGVGAIDANGNVAGFSDWGTVPQFNNVPKPDLCAPGVAVTSSVPGNGYQAMSGTSMAAPIVTGTLALLLQKNPAHTLNVAGLLAALSTLVSTLTGAANIARGGRGQLDLTNI
jgi:subtilisin family serine protease